MARRREKKLTVDAFEGGIPVTSMDADGNPVKTGKVIYRDYEKDRSARVVQFLSKSGQLLSFGRTSSRYQVTNPFDFVEPLLDAGFEPRLHHPYNGGAALFATFAHPDVAFPDFIEWDQDQHGGNGQDMNLGVVADLNIRPGYSFRFIAGIFRQVCSNGLITKWLGLGEHKIAGANGDQAGLSDWIEGRFRVLEDFSVERKSTEALEWPVRTMESLFDESLENPGELVAQQPAFVRQPLGTMMRLPKYAKASLLDNLRMLGEEKGICQLDLLNCITNTAIRRGEDGPRTRWPIYRNLDGIHGALSTLVEAGAFRAGVEGFS